MQTEVQHKQTARPICVGDVVIMNEIEQPSGEMLMVVVGRKSCYFVCKYLNADKRFDRYNRPPMLSRLERATHLEDFGVVLEFIHPDKYVCRVVGESRARYPDGRPRPWQERVPMTYRYRKEVFEKIVPF